MTSMTHIHVCYYCERTEEVEGANPRLELPEDWHWKVQKEKDVDAVSVCPKCWSDKLLEVVLGRERAKTRPIRTNKRGGCCG